MSKSTDLIARYKSGNYEVSDLLEDVMDYLERKNYETESNDREEFNLIARYEDAWDYDDNGLQLLLEDAITILETGKYD